MGQLFLHPEGGIILKTSSEKLHFNNEEMVDTDINTDGLEEAPADITAVAMLDNCLQKAKSRKSADYIAGVQQLLQHMVENFE